MTLFPCKQCIVYAKCYVRETIVCTKTYDIVAAHSCTGDGTWQQLCDLFPNMERIRWEAKDDYDYKYKPGYSM